MCDPFGMSQQKEPDRAGFGVGLFAGAVGVGAVWLITSLVRRGSASPAPSLSPSPSVAPGALHAPLVSNGRTQAEQLADAQRAIAEAQQIAAAWHAANPAPLPGDGVGYI